MPKKTFNNNEKSRFSARLVDVARRAGVSVMTVSRALRGLEGVSGSKRAEILGLAKEMNYLPDMTARSMAIANSDLVGICLPTLFNDVFADVLSGMRRTFRNAGLATLVETSDYSVRLEAEWIERLLSWRPAGVVLTGFDHDPEARNMLDRAKIPVVEIWDWRADPIRHCVGIDHHAAGIALGKHGRALGYRYPAFIGAPEGLDTRAEKRLAGILETFDGMLEIARPGESNAFEAGRSGARMLFDRDRRPDVIFCLNDHIAFGAMIACTEAGLDVPRDIGIVGFNGLPLAGVLPLTLTTMRTPRREMGILAAQAIIAERNGVSQPMNRCLPCTMVPALTTRQQP